MLEGICRDRNVEIKSFRADNNPFNCKEFKADCELKGQSIDFSAPYAHHMNSVAERGIHTVVNWARSIMLHSMLMWPDQFDAKLWNLAMQHACFIYNRMPSPHQRFAGLVPSEGRLPGVPVGPHG